MPKKQNILKEIVLDNFEEYVHSKLNAEDVKHSKYNAEVISIYNNLGGCLAEAPINYGSWDISTKDFIIEVDEELHFNQYRLGTLKSKIYQNSNSFSIVNYRNYCLEKEFNCIKAGGFGGKWKNNSTEKMFIKSAAPGELNGSGSSRWRQRAYYDFLKDLTSIITNIPVYRISIYDDFKGQRVDQILKSQNKVLILQMLKSYLK